MAADTKETADTTEASLEITEAPEENVKITSVAVGLDSLGKFSMLVLKGSQIYMGGGGVPFQCYQFYLDPLIVY